METRVLTLWQPWASLCVLPLSETGEPVKRWETRGWAVPRTLTFPFRLIVHAAARRPEHGMRVGPYIVDDTGEVDEQPILGHVHERGLWWLPLAAMVGSVVVTDCVPIVEYGYCSVVDEPRARRARISDYPHHGDLSHQQGGLWVTGQTAMTHGDPVRIEDQRPLGDFTPGRYAWAFTDAKPTTRRCPRCWGSKWLPDDPTDTSGDGSESGCPTCHVEGEVGGRGVCRPVPYRNGQGLRRPRWED